MELLVILYSEAMLEKVYKIYQMHQAKNNLPFMRLNDYREMFEEQQQMIIELIEEEEQA
jgi:hypothetical protein|tara:strand:+ start:40 stop:216 length:177 start_codon:yes stop_codon:yes gene_type:complete